MSVILALAAPLRADTRAKVDATLLQSARAGTAGSFFVELGEEADLSGAAALAGKIEKGRYVFDQLREVADRTQPPVEQAIRQAGFETLSFYIVNRILVIPQEGRRVSQEQLVTLASRDDVSRILPVAPAELLRDIPLTHSRVRGESHIPDNIEMIGASNLHHRGIDGRGVVVGVSDTGMEWTHPTIESRYRGSSASTANHDYNWFDPSEERSRVPVDTNGHGTHVTAIVTGGPPGDRVGVAPGAQWIGCRALGPGSNAATVLSCLQFFLAPTDVDGKNPNPDLAPDVTNHSYICPFCELQDAFQALKDAGIVAVTASGNFGPECESVFDPGTYPNVLTVGAVGNAGGIAEFSSRGPVPDLSGVKPEIVAPGAAIRSAYLFDGYESLTGTSHASPHVAGAFALLWNARPDLRGNVAASIELMLGAAKPNASADCLSDSADAVNNLYGHGVLNLNSLVRTAPRRRSVGK